MGICAVTGFFIRGVEGLDEVGVVLHRHTATPATPATPTPTTPTTPTTPPIPPSQRIFHIQTHSKTKRQTPFLRERGGV